MTLKQLAAADWLDERAHALDYMLIDQTVLF
jgi:hypothetical protein